ncbi:L-rhamnose mutarotase [Jiangella gansuensis]|uniref:L-rhamnose mutarotase n=1 Tax=Jiangella gansuensis TaxID=281473 RepID=UPI00047B3AC1|nr:L-rhamnose mutarotase [Jiangella gansuensis]
MRVALHSVLRPGARQDYEREHDRIPADLVETFARIGIHDWTIWRSGDHLFHLVECDDFDAAMRALEDDPANARWQAHIGRFVDRFLSADDGDGDGGGAPTPIRPVWDLGAQRSAGSAPTER